MQVVGRSLPVCPAWAGGVGDIRFRRSELRDLAATGAAYRSAKRRCDWPYHSKTVLTSIGDMVPDAQFVAKSSRCGIDVFRVRLAH